MRQLFHSKSMKFIFMQHDYILCRTSIYIPTLPFFKKSQLICVVFGVILCKSEGLQALELGQTLKMLSYINIITLILLMAACKINQQIQNQIMW